MGELEKVLEGILGMQVDLNGKLYGGSGWVTDVGVWRSMVYIEVGKVLDDLLQGKGDGATLLAGLMQAFHLLLNWVMQEEMVGGRAFSEVAKGLVVLMEKGAEAMKRNFVFRLVGQEGAVIEAFDNLVGSCAKNYMYKAIQDFGALLFVLECDLGEFLKLYEGFLKEALENVKREKEGGEA